jgi:hypothetical protein
LLLQKWQAKPHKAIDADCRRDWQRTVESEAKQHPRSATLQRNFLAKLWILDFPEKSGSEPQIYGNLGLKSNSDLG